MKQRITFALAFVLLLLVSLFIPSCRLKWTFGSPLATPTPTSTIALTETPMPIHTGTTTATFTPRATPTFTASPTPSAVYQLQVPADVIWYSTKIVLHAGQTLMISAQGKSNISGKPNNNIWNPAGDRGYCPSDCLLPGAGYGTLIGKISKGQPFKIGIALHMIVSTDGTLFLAINDNHPYYFDNTGFYDVEVRIW